jgi:hypothetical protein
MTIFLLFPFSRLVHVWSGFASVALPVLRPYQVVRSRRLNLPAGHNLPLTARNRTRSHTLPSSFRTARAARAAANSTG